MDEYPKAVGKHLVHSRAQEDALNPPVPEPKKKAKKKVKKGKHGRSRTR